MDGTGSEDELLISYDKPPVKLGRVSGHTAAAAASRSPARPSRSPAKLASMQAAGAPQQRQALTAVAYDGPATTALQSDARTKKAGSARAKPEEDEYRPSPHHRRGGPPKTLVQSRDRGHAATAASATDTTVPSTKVQGKMPYPSPVSPVSEQERKHKHKREYAQYTSAHAQQSGQHSQHSTFRERARPIKTRNPELYADSPGNEFARSTPRTFAAPELHSKHSAGKLPRGDTTPPGSSLHVHLRSGGHATAPAGSATSTLQSPARIQKKQTSTPAQRALEQPHERHEHERQKQVIVEVQVKSEPQEDDANGDLLGLFDAKSDRLALAQQASHHALDTANVSAPRHVAASANTHAHQPKPLALPPGMANAQSSSPRKRPRVESPSSPSGPAKPATQTSQEMAQSAVHRYLLNLSRPMIPPSARPSLEAIFSTHGVKSQEELEVLIASPDEVQDYWLQAARGAGMSMLWESVLRAALRRSREEQIHTSQQPKDANKHADPT